MTELQQNRYDRLARRVGGLIGAKSMVNDVLGELFPVLDVENVPAELLALMATQLGWCSSVLVPSVGELNHHQIFNPANSQNLIVVTQVLVSTTTTGTFRISTLLGALPVDVGLERRRDTREGTQANLVGENRTEQSAINGGADQRVRVITNEQMFIKDPNDIMVLFPGTGLTVSSEATNILSTAGFFWRERVFEGSEQP